MSQNVGRNSMRHALAWAHTEYGKRSVLTAMRSVAWIPKGDGARVPVTRREDLFGVADLLILRCGAVPLLVQVTTQTPSRSTVWQRRNKTAAWLRYDVGLPPRCDFWVIAWVRRQHFRRWVWLPLSQDWNETEPFWTPKQTRSYEDDRPQDLDAGRLERGAG